MFIVKPIMMRRNPRKIVPATSWESRFKKQPRLNWQIESGYAVLQSGGYRPNIIYRSSPTPKLLIEYPIGRLHGFYTRVFGVEDSTLVGIGLFFEEDPLTGGVHLLLRQKRLNGPDHCIKYRDCRYFGMDTIIQETGNGIMERISKFTVSNAWQDKTIECYLDLSAIRGMDHIVENINDFIQSVLGKRSGEAATAMPLLVPMRIGFITESQREVAYPVYDMSTRVARVEFVDSDVETVVMEAYVA